MGLGRAKTSLIVQIVQSGSAMLVAFMLMPTLGAAGFGVFALSIATQSLLLGIIDSAVLTPLIVMASSSTGGSPLSYMSERLACVLTLCAISAVALLLISLGACSLSLNDGNNLLAPVAINAATAIGAFSLCSREALRATLLVSNRLLALVLTEFGTSCALLVSFALLTHEPTGSISSAQALILIALLNGVTVAIGIIFVRPSFAACLEFRSLYGISKQGAQSLVAAMITWVQSQSYLYFAGWLVSLAVAGYLAASRMAFAPLQTIFSGVARGVMPDLAKAAANQDWPSFRATIRKCYIGFGMVAVAWTLLGAMIFPWIFRLFGAADLVPSDEAIAAWGLVFLMTALRSTGALGLKAASRFDLLIKQGVAGATVSVVAVPAGVLFYGPMAALWALAAAETAAFVYSALSIKSICLTTA